jgi:hypothetical protein
VRRTPKHTTTKLTPLYGSQWRIASQRPSALPPPSGIRGRRRAARSSSASTSSRPSYAQSSHSHPSKAAAGEDVQPGRGEGAPPPAGTRRWPLRSRPEVGVTPPPPAPVLICLIFRLDELCVCSSFSGLFGGRCLALQSKYTCSSSSSCF